MGEESNGLYQTSDKCGLQASTIEAIRQSIQSLQDYLETGDHSDTVYSRTDRERQNRKAIEWATKNDKQIIVETDFLEQWRRGGNIRRELAFIDVIFRKVTPDQFQSDYPGLASLVSDYGG
jgi:hypothetical protein